MKGEEEALTGSNGAFRLSTWKELPLTLHVLYPAGKSARVIVTDPGKPLRILL